MARNYYNWSNARPNGNVLQERPHITNTVNGNKRYYSSLDGEIYFGDLFIDEIVSIQWTVQQQALPIYGYNSYCFDDVVVGSRIIQGQFTINFTKAGFLMELQKNQALPRIARKLYGSDQMATSGFTDEFRKRLNLPIWDGGFDIVVGYGDQNKSTTNLTNTMYSTFTVLDCCQIISSSQILDSNGAPLLEVYNFIARDVKNHTATDAEKNPTTVTGAQDKELSYGNLQVIGAINVSGSQAILRIKSTDGTRLQSGTCCIISSLSDQSLKTEVAMTTDATGDLVCYLDIDKTKSLKAEISKNALSTIRAKVKIDYYKTKELSSSNTGVITKHQIMDFQIA